MTKKKFNEDEYKKSWQKENMLAVGFRYNKEFVLQFREAAKTLGLQQSDIFRKAMQETINKANSKK